MGGGVARCGRAGVVLRCGTGGGCIVTEVCGTLWAWRGICGYVGEVVGCGHGWGSSWYCGEIIRRRKRKKKRRITSVNMRETAG